MKIIEFGLPEMFPAALVPDEAAAFCAEVDGMELRAAADLAQARCYAPIIAKLPHLGDNVWGFALQFDGLNIPFMVKVDAEVRHAS